MEIHFFANRVIAGHFLKTKMAEAFMENYLWKSILFPDIQTYFKILILLTETNFSFLTIMMLDSNVAQYWTMEWKKLSRWLESWGLLLVTGVSTTYMWKPSLESKLMINRLKPSLDSEAGFCTGCWHVRHHQQSISGPQ